MNDSKKLTDYLPLNEDEAKATIQAQIDEKIWIETNKQRRKDNLSWAELLEASCRKYLDERRGQK